jgi:hypothetical protein
LEKSGNVCCFGAHFCSLKPVICGFSLPVNTKIAEIGKNIAHNVEILREYLKKMGVSHVNFGIFDISGFLQLFFSNFC